MSETEDDSNSEEDSLLIWVSTYRYLGRVGYLARFHSRRQPRTCTGGSGPSSLA